MKILASSAYKYNFVHILLEVYIITYESANNRGCYLPTEDLAPFSMDTPQKTLF